MKTESPKRNWLADGKYTDSDGYFWAVARLIEHSKGLDVFDITVEGIYAGQNIFNAVTTANQLAEHVRRVNNADLSHPIILDPEGFIIDGWHRVTKAMVTNAKTIKAVRFKEMPISDGKEDED